jgi:hypothetical protein
VYVIDPKLSCCLKSMLPRSIIDQILHTRSDKYLVTRIDVALITRVCRCYKSRNLLDALVGNKRIMLVEEMEIKNAFYFLVVRNYLPRENLMAVCRCSDY